MKARLFARFGPEKGLEIKFGSEATIGRGKYNTVSLSSRDVSQRHARVFYDPGSAAYWIEDLDSLNGTRLDGAPVSGRERLGGLHVLSFGATAELFFLELDSEPVKTAVSQTTGTKMRVDGEAPTLPAGLRRPAKHDETQVDGEAPTLPAGLRRPAKHDETQVDAEAPTLPAGLRRPAKHDETQVDAEAPTLPPGLQAPGAESQPKRFVLEVLGNSPDRFPLREGENLIGRSERVQIVLADRDLSRWHATLRVAGDRVWLRDEGSRSHTFVAGERISDEVELEPGSELRFGRLEARLALAEPAADEEGA